MHASARSHALLLLLLLLCVPPLLLLQVIAMLREISDSTLASAKADVQGMLYRMLRNYIRLLHDDPPRKLEVCGTTALQLACMQMHMQAALLAFQARTLAC